jgi:adenine deaminase
MPVGPEERKQLLETVRGERPADLFVRGGTIANVYSGELLDGNVAVVNEHIAYVGESGQAVGPQTAWISRRRWIAARRLYES